MPRTIDQKQLIEFDLLIAASSIAATVDATPEQIDYFRKLWENYISLYSFPNLMPLHARASAVGKKPEEFGVELMKARDRAYPKKKRPGGAQRVRTESQMHTHADERS